MYCPAEEYGFIGGVAAPFMRDCLPQPPVRAGRHIPMGWRRCAPGPAEHPQASVAAVLPETPTCVTGERWHGSDAAPTHPPYSSGCPFLRGYGRPGKIKAKQISVAIICRQCHWGAKARGGGGVLSHSLSSNFRTNPGATTPNIHDTKPSNQIIRTRSQKTARPYQIIRTRSQKTGTLTDTN